MVLFLHWVVVVGDHGISVFVRIFGSLEQDVLKRSQEISVAR